MNWRMLILLIVTLESVYRMILHIVTDRSANRPIPAIVADVYDADTYQRWRKYSADKCRLHMIGALFNWFVSVILLTLNVHAAVAALVSGGTFLPSLAVLVFQSLVDTICNTGLQYVEIMVIEQKYGFNRSSIRTFIMDRVRGLIIEILLNIALMWLLSILYGWLGDSVVLLFAGVVFVLNLSIAFLYPILSRMGNKFVPLEDGDLRDRLMALLEKHGYQVKAIEVMDASRRTTKANAYFTGFGRMKTIVLFDNILNTMSTDEICAAFAHELGHGLHKDVPKQQLMNLCGLLLMSVTIWLAIRFPAMHQAFGFEQVNYGFASFLMGAAFGLVQPLIDIWLNAYSRFAELRADQQAVAEGYGEALISGLKKLGKENFTHLSPAPLLVVLKYSHPPLHQRIEAIKSVLRPRNVAPTIRR